MDLKNEKKLYAKIVDKDDYKGVSLDDITFFPCDYILRCVDGPYEGRQLRMRELGCEIIIGSDQECNFFLKDQEVCAKHCRLQYIENTYFYTICDLNSSTGTWLKISSLEEGHEVKGNTNFLLFQHSFIIKEEEGSHIIQFLSGSKAGVKIILEEETTILIGKKGNVELELPCSETHVYKVIKLKGRVFVKNECQEVSNEGLFFQLRKDETELIRAGDIIKIGRCYFRIIVHNWGVFSEIGDRSHQEDKYCIVDDLRIFDEIIVPYYAIYDGHGGGSCSLYLQKHLHNNLREVVKHRNLRNSSNFLVDLCQAIQDCIIYTDISYYESDNFSIHHGSTCVFLFFIGNKVLCCNLGDSISILVRNEKKIYLSKDFRPTREKEKGRIAKKGGYVTTDGRLLGLISVSRGFGDWKFKDPKKHDILKKNLTRTVEMDEYLISNRAEFRIIEIDPQADEYMIICSDGIFQHSSNNDQIFDTITKYLELEKNSSYNSNIKGIPNIVDNVRLDFINSIYNDANVKGKQADNMSMVMVDLQNNKNYY
jgi:serine/threonine protein phosphatase PrpC